MAMLMAAAHGTVVFHRYIPSALGTRRERTAPQRQPPGGTRRRAATARSQNARVILFELLAQRALAWDRAAPSAAAWDPAAPSAAAWGPGVERAAALVRAVQWAVFQDAPARPRAAALERVEVHRASRGAP